MSDKEPPAGGLNNCDGCAAPLTSPKCEHCGRVQYEEMPVKQGLKSTSAAKRNFTNKEI